MIGNQQRRRGVGGSLTPGTSISHKVKILGDSHLRGTASKIYQYLNTKFEVCSWIKPGENTKERVNTLVKDLKCLGTQDVIVINGGSNYTGSNRKQTHKLLVQMTQFVQENNHSNLIIVNIPPRHDMDRNSVTSLEIQTANRKLNKEQKFTIMSRSQSLTCTGNILHGMACI
jgi:hypothetical protein